jgi:NAD(P)-dependent dehydrogenase (short-subunit alcohol dehydrogenase family)
MISRQHPISNGFSRDTTAGEVLAGVDLRGKTVIVTGGYSGIGLATTRAFSDAGAAVVVPARRPELARQELAGIERAEVDSLDLADLASVQRFAERFLASGRRLDVLINNAGIMANPLTRVGPGWESQFAVNHLGHYALTNRLWPALTATGGSRVISVTSRGHKFSAMRWDDLQWNHGYDKWQAYGQAKTANVLFAVELDTLGARFGVRALSVYPGGIRTPLQRHLSHQEMVGMGWIDEQGNDVIRWKSPEQGAATTAWAATSRQLDGVGGVYCEDCDIAEVADPDTEEGKQRGVNPWAIDVEQAVRLWRLCAELTGVDAFATAAPETA